MSMTLTGDYEQKPPLLCQTYARTLQSCGDSHTFIRIKNLATQAFVGGAIWGMEDIAGHRNKDQPVFISSSLSLRKPFGSAAKSDTLNDSTVNYSTLSKEILKIVSSRRSDINREENFKGLDTDISLADLSQMIQICLTGQSPSSRRPLKHMMLLPESGWPCLEDKSSPKYEPPFLCTDDLLELVLTVFLPKATLLSGGVSLTTSTGFLNQQISNGNNFWSSVMKIHDLRIPTLIGVNNNERLAKQLLVVHVDVDPYICSKRDYYNELEQIVVKSTEESSFETLESLATHLSNRIIKYFVFAYMPSSGMKFSSVENIPSVFTYSQVRVSVEKPCAITFADAPSIEIIRSSDPQHDLDATRLFAEWQNGTQSKGLSHARIPFPLQGTLSSWIAENCAEDTT